MVFSLEFAVRVRPPFNHQEAENVGLYIDPSSERIIVGHDHSFTADHVFSSYRSQAVVYARFAPKVRRFFEGHDVTFITLGRSKSGKTHSLVGPLSSRFYYGTTDGLIIRTALQLFDHINKAKQTTDSKFSVFFSFFEAPSEDTVDPNRFSDVSHKKSPMESMNNTYSSQECNSFEEFMHCLRTVMKNCSFERTCAHANSFFMLSLYQELVQPGEVVMKFSRCTFAELDHFSGLSSQVVQHHRLPNAGLNLISRVLSAVSEESNSLSISESPLARFFKMPTLPITVSIAEKPT